MNETEVNKKLESFFFYFIKQQYKKGEILIQANKEPSGVFYIQEGVVRQYVISKKGEELVVNLFKQVSFFPMGWAFNQTRNDYYYEAITNVTSFKAPRQKVVAFLKENPDVLYDLISRVYKGLDGLFSRMTYMMSGGAYERVIAEIIIQAKRFGKYKSAVLIELHVSEKELATQAGMTRETVSREMKILKEKGLVTFSKNILQVHDLLRLEQELLVI
jgi:CRP-like cAMP-binding protein